jgi:hypothetical protein
MDERDVVLVDYTRCQHGFSRKLAKLMPEIQPHSHNRKAFQFAGLDERRDLESFVKGAEPTRHNDKGG